MLSLKRSSIVYIALLLFSLTLNAGNRGIETRLDELTAHFSNDAGVYIARLGNNKVLYKKNANELLNPASTTKIITTAGALKYLGPNFRFHTKYYLTSDKDLYVEGNGDPYLVIEDFKLLVDELVRRGVRSIRHIILNDSYFQGYTSPALGNGKERSTPYSGALSLNFNRTRLKVSPGRRVGDPADVQIDVGEEVAIPIINRVTTTAKRRAAHLKIEPPRAENEDHFIITGKIKKSGTFVEYIPLPPLYFGEVLRVLLRERGCRISGSMYKGLRPSKAKLVLDHESKPLYEIVAGMNKFSNNFMAEQLIKFLGAKFVSVPGTTAKGMLVIKEYLSSLGIYNFTLVNGSGLTYENRISAKDLVKVIEDMYADKNIWPSFEDSLSVAGVDGTLKRKYRGTILYRELKAKTGSLNYVRTIAGVIPMESGEIAGYAILLNNGNVRGYRKLFEDIALTVASQ